MKQTWVDAVVQRLKNPITQEYSEEMKQWATQFSWDLIAKKWENVWI